MDTKDIEKVKELLIK